MQASSSLFPPLPLHSKLQLNVLPAARLQISLPAAGFNAQTLAIVFFLVFWFGFITLWTTMAAMGSILFALFSAPFWVVGFFMAKGIYLQVAQSQQLILDTKQLVVVRRSPLGVSEQTFDIRSITPIHPQLHTFDLRNFGQAFQYMSKMKNNRNAGVHLPTLGGSAKLGTFFETASAEDQDWAIRFLNRFSTSIQTGVPIDQVPDASVAEQRDFEQETDDTETDD